jgi:hypothetical protein
MGNLEEVLQEAASKVLIVTYTTKYGDDLFTVKHDPTDADQRFRFMVCVLIDNDLDDYKDMNPKRAEEFMTLVAAGEWQNALSHWADDQHNRSISSNLTEVADHIDTADAIRVDARRWLIEHGRETMKGDASVDE